MIKVNWSQMKSFVDDRKLSIQFIEFDDKYILRAIDGSFSVNMDLEKDPSDTTDLDDFEDNYKPFGNKSPASKIIQTLGEDTFSFYGIGTIFNATAGAVTTHDFLLDDNYAVKGGNFLAKESIVGDYVELKVIDIDNVLGFGANTVIGTYVKKWYIIPDQSMFVDDVSVAMMPVPGLYLRVVYTSVGATNVTCVLNLITYKVD